MIHSLFWTWLVSCAIVSMYWWLKSLSFGFTKTSRSVTSSVGMISSYYELSTGILMPLTVSFRRLHFLFLPNPIWKLDGSSRLPNPMWKLEGSSRLPNPIWKLDGSSRLPKPIWKLEGSNRLPNPIWKLEGSNFLSLYSSDPSSDDIQTGENLLPKPMWKLEGSNRFSSGSAQTATANSTAVQQSNILGLSWDAIIPETKWS